MSEPTGPIDPDSGPPNPPEPTTDPPPPRLSPSVSKDEAGLRILDIAPGVACRDAALAYYAAGFAVIPVVPGTKRSAVKWDGWLSDLSPKTIRQHWVLHPEHELACILNAQMLVLDADSPESFAALNELERAFGIASNFVVKTRRGEHHYYRLTAGTFARTNVHSTDAHPERVDVKAKRSLVVMPPSVNKSIVRCGIDKLLDLIEADQVFVDQIYRHNGMEPPRDVVHVQPRSIALGDDVGTSLAGLRARLDRLDSDCGYGDWCQILMALHHETDGSDEGFALADEWSARGVKYCGERELRSKWRSFAGHMGPRITVGTINAMLNKLGVDWVEIDDAVEPQFEPCDYEVIQSIVNPGLESTIGGAVASILAKFSITPNLEKLRQEEVEQKYILVGIALMGQATVLYAAPNTGKTLLVIWLLIQAIKLGRVDAPKVIYINCDDSLHGLLTKGAIAKAHGFHMLADGYEGFEIQNLRTILLEVIERRQANGTVLVFDTLKKFTDLMDKRSSTSFMKLIRRFVLKGGTVIMLAHANKKPGPDGKPVYEGVADILNDADCGYISWVSSEAGAAERVVEFEMKKRRGNVLQRVTFAYSGADGLSYEQLLASVRRVDADEAVELHIAAEVRADVHLIEAAKDCIREGIVKRMELYAAIAKRTQCGRRKAEELLDTYTGTDRTKHHWTYNIGPRGAKIYRVLESSGDSPVTDAAPTSVSREAGHE